jgi:hypothetical protein
MVIEVRPVASNGKDGMKTRAKVGVKETREADTPALEGVKTNLPMSMGVFAFEEISTVKLYKLVVMAVLGRSTIVD